MKAQTLVQDADVEVLPEIPSWRRQPVKLVAESGRLRPAGQRQRRYAAMCLRALGVFPRAALVSMAMASILASCSYRAPGIYLPKDAYQAGAAQALILGQTVGAHSLGQFVSERVARLCPGAEIAYSTSYTEANGKDFEQTRVRLLSGTCPELQNSAALAAVQVEGTMVHGEVLPPLGKSTLTWLEEFRTGEKA